jgi:O-antigen ligase
LVALIGWIALSAAWSASPTRPFLEAERGVVYLAAAAVLVLLASSREAQALLVGVLTGVSAVCAYALATRLFPDRLGVYDPAGGYQLGEPVGYPNALGVMAVIGILLALGFATDAESGAVRGGAAAALVVLASTLFFTFSRGSWLALAAGLVVALVVHPRRLRFAGRAAILALPAAVAVGLCSRSGPLTHVGHPLEEAARAGHRLAPALAALLVGALAVGVVTAWLERRTDSRRLRPVLAVSAVAVGLVAAVTVHREAPGGKGESLTARLDSASSSYRADYWSVAWDQYRDHPLLGGGAGSFEREWLEHRPVDFDSRDAHSLYIETLAELGPVGLALLVVALGVPLIGAGPARRCLGGAGAVGAYAAFLAHAGIDWDWEVPAATLPALVCGVALVIWSRRPDSQRRLSGRSRALGLAVLIPLMAFVFVMHVGNVALLRSSEALDSAKFEQAEDDARRAIAWAPWSYEPRQRLGEAQLGQGDRTAARASFRRAIARDYGEWSLWYDLAVASGGDERRLALDRLRRLNPLDPAVRELLASS